MPDRVAAVEGAVGTLVGATHLTHGQDVQGRGVERPEHIIIIIIN